MGFRDQTTDVIDYEGEEISVRKIGAMEWVAVGDEVPDNAGKAIVLYTRLLAASVTSPKLTVDEWGEVPPEHVIALGEAVLAFNGMMPGTSKKNLSTKPTNGSHSGSASGSESSIPAGSR